ncbi:hypothetical protein [Celeribacter sp.]|uniref:hypothetical protein n=1 Tax=Celeribacter sp. TaxID=1890673 RepID=UPI003A92B06F
MQEKTWYDYFDEDPDEEIGRNIEGVFGEPSLVVLPRIYWAYVDWLNNETGGGIRDFFLKLESVPIPIEACRNEAYKNTIYYNYLKREKKNLSRPPWCPAAAPEDFDAFFEGITKLKV